MSRSVIVLIVIAIALIGLFRFGPGAAYYVVNDWRTSSINTELSCVDESWVLPGFRAEAPDGRASIDIVSSEACTLRFKVSDGQSKVKKGTRTELRGDPVPFGQIHNFCFSIKLPTAWDYGSPAVTLVQWHGVPDRLLGETGRSPPLRLLIEDGHWEVMHGYDDRQNSSTGSDDAAMFVASYLAPVDWNRKTRWCFNVRWDENARGAYTVDLDGVRVVAYEGQFGYRDWIAPFLKFGVYVPGAGEMPGTSWTAEFSDIEIYSVDP